MELKALSSRRGFGFLRASNPRKSTSEHHMLEAMVRKANGSGGLRVVSCTEEGVVRMKIVVKRSELKQLVEVMSDVKYEPHRPISSTVEQRLNNLLWKNRKNINLEPNHSRGTTTSAGVLPYNVSQKSLACDYYLCTICVVSSSCAVCQH